MAEAEVGDDVFGDDPTVNRLEAMSAELMGKESAVFVASGTMANLLSVMALTRPGDEVLLGDECHIFHYEVGGIARLGGLMSHTLTTRPDGTLALNDIAAGVRSPNIHHPETRLLCLENTHNRKAGAVISADATDAMAAVARDRGLRVHLDGARLLNASVALGVPAARLAASADTVSFCLSKGLGCPVGSLICGPVDVIREARKLRKMVGGGMRQVGILAAAGIYALENNIDRMAEDHARASALAEGIAKLEPFRPIPPASNMVIIEVVKGSVDQCLKGFAAEGVMGVAFGPGQIRLVPHLNITDDDIEYAVAAIGRAAEAIAV